MQVVLRLSGERGELRMVDDQFEAPTWSCTLAEVMAAAVAAALLAHDEPGISYLAAQSHTIWRGYAKAIFGHAALTRQPKVMPIAASNYSLPVRRSTNSLRDCSRL